MMTTMKSVYRLGPLTEIPDGEGREFHVGGKHIAVFNTRTSGVFAVDAICPHRSGPLADGLVGGSTVVCPFHGWKFDLRTGETLNGTCGINAYAVSVDDVGELVLSI